MLGVFISLSMITSVLSKSHLSGLNMAWRQSTEYLPNQLGTPIRENHYAVLLISQYGLERVTWYGDDGSQISSFRFE